MKRASALQLRGVVPYSAAGDEAGFVLPVFSHQTSDRIYVQVPDARSELCQDFAAVGAVSEVDFDSHVPEISVRLGTPLVFAFRAPSGLVAGTLQTIRTPLVEYANEHPEDTATVLQIAELIDDASLNGDDIKRRMVRELAHSVGESGSRNFAEVSVFLDALWSALARRAPDEKLELLTEARRALLLDASAKTTKIFSTYWRKWLEYEIGIEVSDLKSDLGNVRKILRSAEQKAVFEEVLSKEMQAVVSEPRQEGRIARIIQRAIENPEVGRALIGRYRDSATFANKALELIETNAEYLRWTPEGAFAHWLVDALYSMAYPRQRGILLYELADHLGKYRSFADAILRRAHSSNAEPVVFAREAIEERIHRPDAPKPPVPPRPGYAYPSGSYRYPYLITRKH